MFYDKQPRIQSMQYISMLKILGSLSHLFSSGSQPYLYYRAHENCFCRYFKAENLARHDCSVDAKKGIIGIGLKTWIGSDNQKIAEFGKLKNKLDQCENDEELIRMVSIFRNERIRTTKNMYGVSTMIYHIVKRIPYAMQIYECAFEDIDIKTIQIIPEKSSINQIYFKDNRYIYHFDKAKTTLFMNFDHMQKLEEFPVVIMNDPFDYLENFTRHSEIDFSKEIYDVFHANNRKICLPLYVKRDGKKEVPLKNGLNLWNAGGRKRNPNEISISFHASDRKRHENKNFFPPKGTPFDLILPDGLKISAKVCSGGKEGKEIMSNPNSILGEWLLRHVLELKIGQLVTYELLETIGIDCVVFEKIDELTYKIDFADLDTYESFYSK